MEALSFGSVECFNELGQVQPLLQENDEQGGLDEVCETILVKYRDIDNEKKVPNRTLVDMKSQLVESFFKVGFYFSSLIYLLCSFLREKSNPVPDVTPRCRLLNLKR